VEGERDVDVAVDAMIPGPPPVMIAKPSLPRRRARARAWWYWRSSREVRAEPKIETALPTWASARNPMASSSAIRSIRDSSSSSETIAQVCASRSSSSGEVGWRGLRRRSFWDSMLTVTA